MIRTALVALDGSPQGQESVELAIEWARRFGAGLVGLGVLDAPSITKPEPVSLGTTGFKRERDEIRLAEAHRRVLAFLAEFRARCGREGVSCALLEDEVAHHVYPVITDEPAASVIAAEVRWHRPRLLVMGAYGRHPVRDLFVTSVTRAVLSETPVPVFIGA